MIPLERLTDGSPTARNFDKLAQLVPDAGGVSASVRFGATTVTFTASDTSTTATVSHGLTVTPVAVTVTTAIFSPGIFGVVANLDSDSFDVRAITRSGNHTGSVTVYWIAIG